MFARSASRLAILLTLALGAGAAPAHEGHDHDEEAAVAPAAAAPRGTARTDRFELVAIARAGRITVFLDRAATNEPVTDAVIEAETPEGASPVPPLPDGSYGLDAHWSAHSGEHAVVFTVAAEGTHATVPVTLTIPAPPPEPDGAVASAWQTGLAIAHDFERHLRQPDPLLLLTGGGGFLLGLAVMWLARRGENTRRPGPAALLTLALALCLALPPRAGAHEGHEHVGHEHVGHEPAGHDHAGPSRAGQHRDDNAQQDSHTHDLHAGHDHANATPMALPVGQDLARRLPDGSIFVPKPTQRVLTLRTIVTVSDSLRRTIELPGRIIPDPSGSGVVQSSVGGRLSPPASGLFPRLGTRVRKGEILAMVTPPVQAVDVSDMRQRQGELDQQIAITERRVERYRRLAPGGAVSQVQLEDALAELKGLQDRRAALDSIRQQPEALVAPVDGVIAEANAVAGQMAGPGVQVFQIVDPGRLWVEALSFDAVAGHRDATARLSDGRRLTLAFMGAGLADRAQAVPMHFAIAQAPPDLRMGQFVTVLAEVDAQVDAQVDGEVDGKVSAGARQAGLALPRLSVVRGANGQSLVYEHVAPERFAAREVRVEPLDAGRVHVVSGLSPDLRIVTQGAELLNQVR